LVGNNGGHLKTLTEQISDARATHDIRDVLNLSDRKRVIVCPLPQHVHKHNTPSFSIFWRRNMQWWRCHGSCDMEGDIVDLVGFLRVSGYDKRDPDKIRQALTLLDERYSIIIPQPEPEVTLRGGEWRQYLPAGPEVIEYGATRGLHKDTLEHFKIGQFEHYMTMPCFEEGVLKGVKMRNTWQCDPKKRFWQLEGSRLGLFNFDEVYLKPGVTFIVKGEIPTMMMWQYGYKQTCSPTGGEGSGRATIEKWMTALSLSQLIVIGDNDEAGIELAHKRKKLFNAELVFPPDQFKDVDEWFLKDQYNAWAQIRSWQKQLLNGPNFHENY
jgi:hypothetical protein